MVGRDMKSPIESVWEAAHLTRKERPVRPKLFWRHIHQRLCLSDTPWGISEIKYPTAWPERPKELACRVYFLDLSPVAVARATPHILEDRGRSVSIDQRSRQWPEIENCKTLLRSTGFRSRELGPTSVSLFRWASEFLIRGGRQNRKRGETLFFCYVHEKRHNMVRVDVRPQTERRRVLSSSVIKRKERAKWCSYT